MNLLYHEDLRDYSMSDYLKTIDKKDLLYKTWDVGDCWDQGPTNNSCVGYACSSLVEADPKPVKPAPDPEDIFALAKKLDTKERKGTGIREGLKALQSMGYVKSYYWTDQVTEIVVALLNLGPVVVGIDFYNSMRGVTDRMYASGGIAGQHAVLAYGVDLVKSDFLILNSHGPEWGRLGKARVSFNTMAKILKYGFAIEKP